MIRKDYIKHTTSLAGAGLLGIGLCGVTCFGLREHADREQQIYGKTGAENNIKEYPVTDDTDNNIASQMACAYLALARFAVYSLADEDAPY